MGYVICAILSLGAGAFLMALISAKDRNEELDRVYEQGYNAGCTRTWAQVRKFNRKGKKGK
jgi:hypothetical protein